MILFELQTTLQEARARNQYPQLTDEIQSRNDSTLRALALEQSVPLRAGCHFHETLAEIQKSGGQRNKGLDQHCCSESRKGGSLEAAKKRHTRIWACKVDPLFTFAGQQDLDEGEAGAGGQVDTGSVAKDSGSQGTACHHSGSSPGRKMKHRQRYRF